MAVLKYGYHPSQAHHTLFIKQHGSLVIALIVYVDDVVMTMNDTIEMSLLKLQ